jgi:transcriptional regulator with XRE-family HTH domain
MERTHSFGYLLRCQGKALDLTKAELARRVSCSLELIEKIEADARRPSRQLAEKLADSLGLDAEGTEHDRYIAAARVQLDDEAFAASWADGQALSLEQAIAYAIEGPAATTAMAVRKRPPSHFGAAGLCAHVYYYP